VAECVDAAHRAGQGAVADAGEGGTLHDRADNAGAVDGRAGHERCRGEDVAEGAHDGCSWMPGPSGGITPSCWNTSSMLRSSQCSANSPPATRQMSMECISPGRPVGGIPKS